MVDLTVSLRFKFKYSTLTKGSNLLYNERTYSTNKEQHLLNKKRTLLARWHITFLGKSISTISIRLTLTLFKSQVELWHIIPQVDFLLLIG